MEALLLSHPVKNTALVLLSLFFLPLSTLSLFATYLLRSVLHPRQARSVAPKDSTQAPHHAPHPPKTILITGISMSKGLTLARLFHRSSHRVIGADFSPLACGRLSTSVTSFYTLSPPRNPDDPGPYVASLLRIIEEEKVDLWVSCSGVASAVEDGVAKEVVEKRTGCRAIQFGVDDTRALHVKDAFMEIVRGVGLRVPETWTFKAREEMVEVLRERTGLGAEAGEKERVGLRFIAKCTGMDDKSRGDMTLLPRPTEKETRAHINRLDISESNPWILQEFIKGPEFCTHSLVIDGQIKAFVACPSAELLMHYEALPPTSPLSLAMLSFTTTIAENRGKGFTGHLSFDFLVKEEDVDKQHPKKIKLYPIECNPRAHTAVVLFNNCPEMVEQYLSVLPRKDSDTSALSNGTHTNDNGVHVHFQNIIIPHDPPSNYWLGHDLLSLFLLPSLYLLTGRLSPQETLRSYRTFITHVLYWKEGTFEIWDPLPWWWLYHVYWPMRFVDSLREGAEGRWSRVNVSTGKMFRE